MTNQLIKDTSKDFEICLFNNKEKVNDFEFEKEEIQTLIKPSDKNNIQIEDYYIINKEIETSPQYYAIESIK